MKLVTKALEEQVSNQDTALYYYNKAGIISESELARLTGFLEELRTLHSEAIDKKDQLKKIGIDISEGYSF